MSFNIEQVRKSFNDPAIARISEMTKRIARLESDNVEIETDDLTGFGDLDHTDIIYTDYWNFAKTFALKRDHVTLDGGDDYLDLGARTNFWSKNITTCSASIWLCPMVLDPAAISYHTFLGIADDLGGGNTDAEISCYFTNDGPSGYYLGMDITNNNYSNTILRYSVNPSDIIGCWYHFLFTFNGNLSQGNRVNMYVNGVLQSNVNDDDDTTGSPYVLDIDSGTKAFLGKYIASDTHPFAGKIRDFRWFNTTLTPAQALATYRNEPNAPLPDYWLPLGAISSGNPVDTTGIYTADLVSGALFPDRVYPHVIFEPDFNKFRLDLKFNQLLGQLKDYSGFNNDPTIFGEPCPATASEVFFRGGYKRNSGWSIKPQDHVYMRLPSNSAFQVINQQSWIFRVNFRSLNDNPEGFGARAQTLVEKYDDANNQYFIRVDANGDIKAGFKDDGADSKARTSNNPIKIGQEHEIVVTYNSSGDVITFYVDGQVQPQTTTTEGYDSSTFSTDVWFLSAINGTPEQGMGYCDLNYIDCIKYYDDMVLTAQQVKNHYKTKFTISNTEQGEVGIVDGSVVGVVSDAGVGSYTLTSFTTTSFTAV